MQTDNLCSNLSHAFDYFDLDDNQSYTYTLKFESNNRCGEAYQNLEIYYLENNTCIKNNCAASGEIQALLSRDALEQVYI